MSAGLFGLAAGLFVLTLHMRLGPIRSLDFPALTVGPAIGAGFLLGRRLLQDARQHGEPLRGLLAGAAVTACAVSAAVAVAVAESVVYEAGNGMSVAGAVWYAASTGVLLGMAGLVVALPFGVLAGLALYLLATRRGGAA